MPHRDGLVDRDQRGTGVRKIIEQLYDEYKPLAEGELADYIPELANVAPDAFAVSVATTDSRRVGPGDGGRLFTLQLFDPDRPWQRQVTAST